MVVARAGELAEKKIEGEGELNQAGWECDKVELENGVKAISCRDVDNGEVTNKILLTDARIKVDSEKGVIDLERSPQATMRKV